MSDHVTANRDSRDTTPRAARSRIALGIVLVSSGLVLAAAIAVSRVADSPRDTQPSAVNTLSAESSAKESGSDGTKLALPNDEVQYLQDAEHFGGFVVGDVAFPKIAKALRDRDADALAAFFDSAFAGRDFDHSSGRTVEFPFSQFRDWNEDRDQSVALNRDDFLKRWFSYRDALGEIEAVSLSVMLMSPETQGDLAGPWNGSFKLRLAGKTPGGQLAEWIIKFRCRIKNISDETPNQSGWLLSCEAYQARYCQSAESLMRDITSKTGIATAALWDNWTLEGTAARPPLTGGVYLADYDQDGYVDVLITDLRRLYFYKARPDGTFQDVTLDLGLPPVFGVQDVPSLGAVFADLDGDGYEDLLVGPRLYRNVGGQRFERLEHGRQTNLALAQSAMKYAVADYDRDGRLDLYVVGLASIAGEQQPWIGQFSGSRNQLWRNLGGWQFEDVTANSGTAGNGSSTFAAVWFDANGDDWPDLMTACEFGVNDYFLNQGNGTFRPGQLPEGYGGFSMGISVDDIDNDGFGDPYVGNMYSKAGERIMGNLRPGLYPPDVDSKMRDFVSGNELYHNLGDGRFRRAGRSAGVSDVGWAYGTCFADLDNDGFVDLYTPVGFQSVTPSKPDG